LHDGGSNPTEVTVTVPARLHLGFLDLNGGLGRRFGGLGLAISDLKTVVTVRPAKRSSVSGSDGERVSRHLRTMEKALGLDTTHAVKVSQAVPAHVGLGSGTQLALAVAAGLRRLHNLPLAIESDALALGRGARSGIGIGLFHRGGFVVDGGHGGKPGVAPIICHLPFPDHWRVLLIFVPQHSGVHGADEGAAFAALAPMPEEDADRICRLVLMQALPALIEHDIENFGAAIKALQARIGSYFAHAQGGRIFTNPAVAAVLTGLDAAGAYGIGQSSWGPTGFAFASSSDDASRLAAVARQHPSSTGLEIRICSGLNHGAEIVALSNV
jgi:beta-ribofuranosylaminobenzene 5'-phosphate synthase